MAVITGFGNFPLNIDSINIVDLWNGAYTVQNSSEIQVTTGPGTFTNFYGSFQYDALGNLAGGVLTEISDTEGGFPAFDIKDFSVSATAFLSDALAGNDLGVKSLVLAGDDTFYSSAFDDLLRGYGGDDTFVASAGHDTFDGGSGSNAVQYSGPFVDFTLTANNDGTWTVQDNRAGAPNGVDTLVSIQTLHFSDWSISIGAAPSSTTLQQVDSEFQQLFRTSVSTALGLAPSVSFSDGSSAVNSVYEAANLVLPLASELQGGASAASAAQTLINEVRATSSVAILAYEFFTGSAPSAGGMDYLVSPTGPNPDNLNSAYYQGFNTINRYINFASNLGRAGAGSAQFAADYGALTPEQAMTKAYQTIFGGTPSADKVNHLLYDLVPDGNGGTETRLAYFESYGQDGASGVGTKAAMVGWLLAEAVAADLGTYAKSNDAFLTDVALHNAAFGVDIIGHYAQPSYVYNPG